MKSRLYIAIFVGLIVCSCEYNYNIEIDDTTSKVVVNSIINPDSTIKAKLYWTHKIDDTDDYKFVESFDARIFEDGELIFDKVAIQDSLLTNIYPKVGSLYRLEIEVPSYGEIQAVTSIPLTPTIEARYISNKDANSHFEFFEVTNISSSDTLRSVILRCVALYDEYPNKQSDSFYITNSFCDQFNSFMDQEYTAEAGSGMGYDYFLRIPYVNIEKAMPLNFSVYGFQPYYNEIYIGEDEWGYPKYDLEVYNTKQIVLEVIAPTDEYDRYLKSAYQQHLMGDASIFSQPLPVSSNIKGGLGIFAGYSLAKLIIKTPNE